MLSSGSARKILLVLHFYQVYTIVTILKNNYFKWLLLFFK